MPETNRMIRQQQSPCGDSRPRLSLERSPSACRVRLGRSLSQTSSADRGYILLSLLLAIALLSIVAASAATSIAFKIRRDREEELIHRGAEYSRAIRRYTKKVGHYPLRIEDLENTDGLRFLRKRYKDPITGKDFKLLHMTDLQVIGVGGLGASMVPASAMGQPATNFPNAAGGFGGNSAVNSTVNNAMNGGMNNYAPGGASSLGTSSFGSSSFGAGGQAPAQTPSADDPSNPGQAAGPNAASSPASSQSATQSSTDAIGGGVIVGVASASKSTTIREFNRKNHYSDWLFFYDPAYDRGFPINGPTSLTLPTFNNPAQPPGQSLSNQSPSNQSPSSQPSGQNPATQ
jgi:type II secretory pathway pseudopilin PulG